MIVLVITLLLLALILLRVPVAFAILVAGLVGMVAIDGFSAAVAVLQVIPMSASGKFSLSAIPLFSSAPSSSWRTSCSRAVR